MLDLQPHVDRSAPVREQEFWPAGLRRYRFDGRVFGQGPLYALPKDIGDRVSKLAADPKAVAKDPGAAVQEGLGGLLGGSQQKPQGRAAAKKR